MSGTEIAAVVALSAGVLAELVCCVGVWWFRDVFDRLHFAAAGTTVGPVLIGVAVALTGFSTASATVQCLTAVFALVVLNPVLTHVTARAARQLLHGDVQTSSDGRPHRADGRESA